MKTKVNINAVALSLKEESGKEGNKFYKISIDQDGEAGTLSISEEVYKSLSPSFLKYKPITLTAEFNDQYKSLRVIGASQGIR